MLKFAELKVNQEYIFFSTEFVCTGFFLGLKDNVIELKNSSFYFQNQEFAVSETYINTSKIYSFARM